MSEATQHPRDDVSPIPWRSALMLIMISFAEGLSINFYTTITALMITFQFGVAPDKVGYYVGYFATAFFVGQIISNFPLSWISDRIGRKPVLLAGLFFNVICQLCFGMTKIIWVAIAIRFINGILNCGLPVTKCYVRETSDVSNQGRMFSFREIGFSVGGILAPLVGSIFARPADQYWFEGTFFASAFFVEYPYALVCYIVSTVDLICFITGIIFMRETIQSKSIIIQDSDDIELVELHVQSENNSETSDILETIHTEHSSAPDTRDEKEIKIITHREPKETSDEFENESIDNDSDEISLMHCEKEKSEGTATIAKRIANRFSFLDKSTTISILLYMITSFTVMSVIQIFPVWAARPTEENGLNFEEKQIGILNTIGAFAALLFQITTFTFLDTYFGCIVSFRLSLVYSLPIVFLTPFLIYLLPFPFVMWICAIFLIASTVANLSWSFGEVFVMINNAARSDSVGTVNGLSTALAALARIVSPVLATSLFAWSANLDSYYPFNYMLVFHVCCLITLVNLSLTAVVPPALNRNRNIN